MSQSKVSINSLLTNMKSTDPDNRYMALSDLIANIDKSIITSEFVNQQSHYEEQLFKSLYELLNYFNSPVQNLAIKSIKALATHGVFRNPANLARLVENLYLTILNDSQVDNKENSGYGSLSSGSLLTKENMDDMAASPDSLVEVSALSLHAVASGLLSQWQKANSKEGASDVVKIMFDALLLGGALARKINI